MSMQDPIADMLTRIRNAQLVGKKSVSMGASKIKLAIATVLKAEGYVAAFLVSEGPKPELTIELKYHKDRPVISKIERSSRPGLRKYAPKTNMPEVMNGLGVAIISTSQGVMTAREAANRGFGGEVLCTVS